MSRRSRGSSSPTPDTLDPSESSPLTHSTRSQEEHQTQTPYDYNQDSDSSQESKADESENSHRKSSSDRVAHVYSTHVSGGIGRMVNPLGQSAYSPAATLNMQQAAQIPTRRLVSSRVPEEMPRVGTKSAPKKFKGEYDYVESFFRQFEQMC